MLSKKITIENHPIKWPLQLYQRVAGKQRLAECVNENETPLLII